MRKLSHFAGRKSLFAAVAGLFSGGTGPAFSFEEGASFHAPLTTSVVPVKGTGSATFTRATTATVTDFEGKVRKCLSGEVRFQGARRVRNLLANSSEALSNVAWTKFVGGDTSVTITDNYAEGPDGSMTASRVQMNAGTSPTVNSVVVRQPLPFSSTNPHSQVASVWIKSTDANEYVVALFDTNNGIGINTRVIAGQTWTRYQFKQLNIARTNCDFSIGIGHVFTSAPHNGSTVADILVWHPQMEDITGQSNQNPSEYVSVGVLSSPFHGAGVDGVKYFDYENGNTVASNVVTEAQGSPISTSTLLGYLSEQASTNLVLQSENFGTTWSAVGTPTRSAAAKTCGSVVLDLIGDDSAAAAEGYTQGITFTGDATKAISVFISQGTATSTMIQLYDSTAGASRLRAGVAWVGGVPSVTFIDGSLLGTDTLGNGVFRLRFLTSAITAANTNALYVYPAAPANADPALTGDVYIGGVQAENNTFATSYIPTTTAAVTRNADQLTYPTAGNVIGTTGTAYAEIFLTRTDGVNTRYAVELDAAGNRPALFIGTSTTPSIFDGTNVTASIGALALNTPHKIASRYAGAAKAIIANGGAITEGAFDGDMNVGANMNIGGIATRAVGTIRNVKLWTRAATDADLVRMTR